jgi:hypothetical protein
MQLLLRENEQTKDPVSDTLEMSNLKHHVRNRIAKLEAETNS